MLGMLRVKNVKIKIKNLKIVGKHLNFIWIRNYWFKVKISN